MQRLRTKRHDYVEDLGIIQYSMKVGALGAGGGEKGKQERQGLRSQTRKVGHCPETDEEPQRGTPSNLPFR